MKSLSTFLPKIIGLVLLLVFFLPTQITAQEQIKTEALFQMSLEDLWNMEVDMGNMVGLESSKNPLSITTITAEDIKHTPARNIYDLIEVYVPGALWMEQASGKHPGIRGIIIDANYKILLLVNGVNMGLKNFPGAISELENWNLSDIESIDIVRGPGSVRYGPGAIAGVINITTRNGKSSEGLSVNTTYYPTYNSTGADFSYGRAGSSYDYFITGSITRTRGLDETHGWEVTLKGESLNIANLKTPATGPLEEKTDFEGKILEKTYLYGEAIQLIDTLFENFLKIRLSPDWKRSVIPQIRDWIYA